MATTTPSLKDKNVEMTTDVGTNAAVALTAAERIQQLSKIDEVDVNQYFFVQQRAF